MGLKNSQRQRLCAICNVWYDSDSDSLIPCPICGSSLRLAGCNRCGYIWEMHTTLYPKNCPGCKSPYYNHKRIQDREEVNKARRRVEPVTEDSEAADISTLKVMATGVFDIIHPGHISYLKQAGALGGHLTVVVACDATVRKNKHEPIMPEEVRAQIVEALKPVDEVVIGTDGDIFETVERVRPDVIVLGYDQQFREIELSEMLEARGFKNIRIARASECADDLNATRRIISKIREMEQ